MAERTDYGALLDSAVGSEHDDNWAYRTLPNSGTKISEDLFRVTDEYASDYIENMNERRNKRNRP